MAKTIEQLAEEYYNGITSSNQDFIDGANAVLEEIIDCFPNSFVCNPDEVLGTIAERIKELKGE